MRILAFDTSAREFSVALMENESVLYYQTETDFGESHRPKRSGDTAKATKRGSSSLLIPAIENGLKVVNWRPADLELIALTIGPGSFTGLRVGVVTAKSLAYVHQVPLVAVNTLEVIATQTIEGLPKKTGVQTLRAVINAQRQQLFSGRFVRKNDGGLKSLGETAIVDFPFLLNSLEPAEIVTGSGLKPFLTELEARRKDIFVAPPQFWNVTAAAVGTLGLKHFRSGKRDDLWAILPEYYRPSAAEEKAR